MGLQKQNSKTEKDTKMEDVRTSNIITRETFAELQSRSILASKTLSMVRGKLENEDGATFKSFLIEFDVVIEYLECAAWESAENDTEAGKKLFKLCDVAKRFSSIWKEENPSTADDLKAVEKVRGYIYRLSNNPLSAPNWEGLEKIAGSEVVANAGEKVNLGDVVLNVEDVCKEEDAPVVDTVDEEEQVTIKAEALDKTNELIEFVERQEYSTTQANDFCALCAMRDQILNVWKFDDVEKGVRRVKKDLEKRGAFIAPYLVEIIDLYKNKRATE